MNRLCGALARSPVIAAIKDENRLDAALDSPCEVLLLLTGNICTIRQVTERIHRAQKQVYLHVDLLEGFGRDRYALRYIQEHIRPDGIITTKTGLVKAARELKIFAIQRIFLIDNLSFESGISALRQIRPDAVEIMPGIMPAITRQICDAVDIPVITGGLISTKEDIIASLNAGAVGASTSRQALWSE